MSSPDRRRIDRRRRITLAARTLCAALALATLLLWSASLFTQTRHAGTPFNRAYTLTRGVLRIEWTTREPDGSLSGFGNPGWSLRKTPLRAPHTLPALRSNTPGTLHALILPLWPLPLLFAAASWRLARAARHLRDPALCSSCGYPRRGLPTGAPCPECGTLTRLFRDMAHRLSALTAIRVRPHPQPSR